MPVATSLRHPLAELFREAAPTLRSRSATTARLLADAGEDLAAGGVTAAVMAGHERERSGTAPHLRFAAAVHRLVLAGQAPGLARHYATAGGALHEPTFWSDAQPVLAEHVDELRAIVNATHVQTNEPGRSAPLYGGLLVAAERAARYAGRVNPFGVRLLEVGASAGLNLRPHLVGYRLADGTVLGDQHSPMMLDVDWTGLPPASFSHPLRLVHRAGCDLDPVDVSTADGLLHLASFVWPDQLERFRRLHEAVTLARQDPVPVQRASGAEWLEHQLAKRRRGVLTVVWHSVIWQYVTASDRARGQQVLAKAAARATDDTPLALLVYESRRVPGDRPGPEGRFRFDLLLRLWPAGLTVCLGHGSGHGIPFTWSELPA
jgi:hypothetical protein